MYRWIRKHDIRGTQCVIDLTAMSEQHNRTAGWFEKLPQKMSTPCNNT